MTVAELIAILQTLPQDLSVYYVSDGCVLTPIDDRGIGGVEIAAREDSIRAYPYGVDDDYREPEMVILG